MTLGSLFDGIGGWLLAAERAGITPVWASENNAFCQEVTAKHFPNVRQLGDITKLATEPMNTPPRVDVITAGSPCQDLSVAGKQAGLCGERSGLFYEAIRIVRTVKPRFYCWENVPGAFSSNGGRDFQAVLREIVSVVSPTAEIPLPPNGKWSDAGVVDFRGENLDKCQIAWRILDAQFWGVPQRRKRIFLVADFGGRLAAKILFERAGLQGDTRAGQAARQDNPGEAPAGAAGANPIGIGIRTSKNVLAADQSPTLDAFRAPCVCAPAIGFDAYSSACAAGENTAPALRVGTHGGASAAIGFGKNVSASSSMAATEERTPTLRATMPMCAAVSVYDHRGNGGGRRTPAISTNGGTAGNNVPFVMYDNHPLDGRLTESKGVAPTVRWNFGKGEKMAPLVQTLYDHNRISGNVSECPETAPGVLAHYAKGEACAPMVYGIASMASNSMKSPNPDSGIYEAETSRALDSGGGNPVCNQGGMAVVSYALKGTAIGRKPENGGNGVGVNVEVSPTLTAIDRHAVAAFSQQSFSGYREGEVGAALKAKDGIGVGGSSTLVCSLPDGNPTNVMPTLDTNCVKPYGNQCTAIAMSTYAQQSFREYADSDVAAALKSSSAPKGHGGEEALISQPVAAFAQNQRDEVRELGDKTSALAADPGMKQQTFISQTPVFRETAGALCSSYGTKWNGNASAENGSLFAAAPRVRRLTPLECERLQGLPDGWTLIESRRCSDAARYKALGNGMAQPCADFIIGRLAELA